MGKTAVCLLFVCFLGTCFAAHVQSSGLAWQGTWTEGKRNFGGNMYICVDIENNVAWGSYSGAGLFSGKLKGADFDGEWYEAGYDRPFGPFSLTLSGTSFSGSWSYYNNTNADSTETFSWTGSRTSSSRPADNQCITPVKGNSVVGGYTPDAGRTMLMSDFVYRSGDSGSLRPETTNSVFGPCTDCNGPNTLDDRDNVHTGHIVIGAAIDDATFCGFFWEGFYNDQISDAAICFSRTSLAVPAPHSCGSNAVIAGARRDHDLGNTELLLSEIQRALDALTLPQVVIVPGPFDGDDDNYSSDFFTQFLSSGASPISTGNSPVSTGNSPVSSGFTSFSSTTYSSGETSFFSTVDFTPDGGVFSSSSFASALVVPLATIFVIIAMAF